MHRNGWIKVHRKLLDNHIWQEKPFSKGQAWIDLILRANYEETKILSGCRSIRLEMGQVYTTVRELSERWGWSGHKVVNFLRFLEEEQMIAKEGNAKGTILTIEKYSDFQNRGNTVGTAWELLGERSGNARELPTYYIKNRKKNKNEKKCMYSAHARARETDNLLPYGRFKNVFLSESEYEEIVSTYQNAGELIEKLSLWLESKDRPGVRNHYAQLLIFARNDNWPKQPKPRPEGERRPVKKEPMPEEFRRKLGMIRKETQ